MTLQHLDKPLSNYAGSAQNSNRKLIAHKKVYRFYNSPYLEKVPDQAPHLHKNRKLP
jgi:hypothetical protein